MVEVPVATSASSTPPRDSIHHDDEADDLRSLLLASTVSNVFLFLGGSFFVVFAVRELITFCRRDTVADVVYMVAAGCFFLSGSIQLLIDLSTTTVAIPRGRYTASHASWNRGISILFLIGVVLDLIAFTFWRKGEVGVPTERRIQWGGSHLWLLAAILVLWRQTGWTDRTKALAEKLDLVGNVFFLCEALINSSARYWTMGGNSFILNFPEMRLEIAAAVFWTFNAFCFLYSDSVRLRQYYQSGDRPTEKMDEASHRTPRETTKDCSNDEGGTGRTEADFDSELMEVAL